MKRFIAISFGLILGNCTLIFNLINWNQKEVYHC